MISESYIPNRKVVAASGFTALVTAITGAFFGVIPVEDAEARDAISYLIDFCISGAIGWLLPFIPGYMVKERE